jgi:superfamily II DNA or RNA helicase
MARILIFAGNRAALERYDMAKVPILTYQHPPEVRRKIFAKFCADRDGQLVVTARIGTEGFKVPYDTFLVFDSSWPYPADHPYTVQALGRVSLRRKEEA